jgi:glycine dehydrogenase
MSGFIAGHGWVIAMTKDKIFSPIDTFPQRHIGPNDQDIEFMLETLNLPSLDALGEAVLPPEICLQSSLNLPQALAEQQALDELARLASKNRIKRSFIGMGYYNCLVPGVIQRNILENPGWYTQYTPYQAEIAQGRLEALLNYQTMVSDLTGLPVANASLLDEATAAAEAMTMCYNVSRKKRSAFFACTHCHPQTLAVLHTRAEPLGIEILEGSPEELFALDPSEAGLFGALIQTPTTDGLIFDISSLAEHLHHGNALLVTATDLLASTLVEPPGKQGADIVIGSSQRFGVPMGFGGPHAGFISTRDSYIRHLPGRLIGLSKDAQGNPAYRMTLQTREQHIRRDRATSNICTAQVLLAIMAGMYAVYHGPDGLRRIARRVHQLTAILASSLNDLGCQLRFTTYFDTLRFTLPPGVSPQSVRDETEARDINLRYYDNGDLGVSLDETVTRDDLENILHSIATPAKRNCALDDHVEGNENVISEALARQDGYLTHPVFNRYHSEHEMLRYIHRLQTRDLSLDTSMIPLGSCTMKLNATTEMIPVTWPEFASMHPFAPKEQTRGYQELFENLEEMLAEITGFDAISLQPNAGSQGEYAGLLIIRAYHQHHNQHARNICLIPVSAHGTNAASAVMAGFKVVPITCDKHGNIDRTDLEKKIEIYGDHLGAMMITYPSTHGVFEAGVTQICKQIHGAGGLVYMDGANMNAQVGLCRPGDIGADVCHLNLHKTFCIPHGGGGPGMGPIGVVKCLTPFLPGHPVVKTGGATAMGAVSAAPYGSPSILPISYLYISMMGEEGLKKATQVAILNANYMAHQLKGTFDILYSSKEGWVAHEFIIDMRAFKQSCGIAVDDIAKRLMDYGFHAPTMSWPVAGTMMVEPTESESREELDRFCQALISIRNEIKELEEGRGDLQDNALKNSPHTAAVVTDDHWPHPYSRHQAAYSAPWSVEYKFWPPVGRIDNAYGDRNLFCTCPPMEVPE